MPRFNELLHPLLPGTPYALLDVRSETEFEKSAIPGFHSLPLLYQEERHQVGLCYKNHGQDAAIALGHQLVDPHRAERVAAWGKTILESPAQKGLVMCWRGGLRSKIATQWIRAAGFAAEQVNGGYKAIRRLLLEAISNPPPMIVISGPTGSGKTELLHEFQDDALDLEAIAEHRGSAFGGLVEAQISQTRFENAVALRLFRNLILVEDESRLVGRLSIPEVLHQAMRKSPMIYLEADTQERIQRIYDEYIALPLAQGRNYPDLELRMLANLDKLKRRLDKNYPAIRKAIKHAFSQAPEVQHHGAWIEGLLLRYYDPMYRFSLQRTQRHLVFSGDRSSCRAWLRERLRSS